MEDLLKLGRYCAPQHQSVDQQAMREGKDKLPIIEMPSVEEAQVKSHGTPMPTMQTWHSRHGNWTGNCTVAIQGYPLQYFLALLMAGRSDG